MGKLGRNLELMQMASLLQNKMTEFPMAGERPNRQRGDPKKIISPHTGRQIPTAVAQVEKGDSDRAVRLKQEAVSAANG